MSKTNAVAWQLRGRMSPNQPWRDWEDCTREHYQRVRLDKSSWPDTHYQTRELLVSDPETCREDGRCQYAIDHGADGLGHCPTGKCCMSKPQSSEDFQTWFEENKKYTQPQDFDAWLEEAFNAGTKVQQELGSQETAKEAVGIEQAWSTADALYEAGYNDAKKERDFDARNTREWQSCVDAIERSQAALQTTSAQLENLPRFDAVAERADFVDKFDGSDVCEANYWSAVLVKSTEGRLVLFNDVQTQLVKQCLR